MLKQQCAVLIKHVTAGAEITRSATTNVRCPHASDGWPIESLVIFRQEA